MFLSARCCNQLTREAYFDACFELMVYLDRGRIHLDDTPGGGLEIFLKAEAIAKKHKLDLSDAFQIISMKHGKEFIAAAAQESKTVIATADLELETAAEKEGFARLELRKEPTPARMPDFLTASRDSEHSRLVRCENSGPHSQSGVTDRSESCENDKPVLR